METKFEKHFFSLADFEEEQEFLMKHHREGWKLISFNRKYEFEKCSPEEYCYQLDFNPEQKGEEDYIQMFVDCGWEFICKFREWYYFRKQKAVGEECSIFSDKESKIDMCKKVLNKQALITVAICFVIWSWDFLLFFTGILKEESVGNTIALIVGSLLMIASVFVLGIVIGNTLKLNKMVRELSNPIKEFENKK